MLKKKTEALFVRKECKINHYGKLVFMNKKNYA